MSVRRITVKQLPEPLLPSGKKYVAYDEDGRPQVEL